MQSNVITYFLRTVEKVPDKIAVVDGDHMMNFRSLEDKTYSVAYEILKKSNIINRPVAVYLPKSFGCIYADLGIILSGNLYMNLDVNSPVARITNILVKMDPAYILTSEAYLAQLYLAGANPDKIIKIEDLPAEPLPLPAKQDIVHRLDQIIDTDPLCIINTSGSTGTPKGVVLSHRSFIDFTEWAIETLGIKDVEIIGSLSPAVFDIYSFELCMLMAKSSTIVLIPEKMAAFPITILQLLQSARVTFIFWVPTIMVNIANLDLLRKISLTDLQKVIFAGEVFPTKQFNYWRRSLPNCTMINLYGPIEITLDCTYYIADRELDDNEPVPIGFPCHNTDILLLNEKNQPAGKNEDAELCVRGTSLSMGYYNDPEKTALAFVQNPLNHSYPEVIYRTGDLVYRNDRNEIIFKGRKDSQIKHMGYRIELTEIEHILINSIKIIDNGCVVYNSDRKEITLFYESKADITVKEIKEVLSAVIPKYMIPTAFYRLNELPRNVNGKIDRLALHSKINSHEQHKRS